MVYTLSTGLDIFIYAISGVVTLSTFGADWKVTAAARDVSYSLTLVTLERGTVKGFSRKA